MLELADCSLYELPEREGPSTCTATIFLLGGGKTNKTGNKEYMGALRHKDPILCVVGALAILFFWRWHLAGEAPPNFKSRKSWYKTKLLVGKNKDSKITYPTQYQDVIRAFEESGIVSQKVTHAPRKQGANAADEHGVAESHVSYYFRFIKRLIAN